MATIRAYTTIEQSKRLVEILPPESADMCYIQELLAGCKYGEYKPHIGNLFPAYGQDKIKCWSLATLLKLIPDSIYENTDDFAQLEITKRSLGYHDINDNIVIGTLADNLVDACVEMVIKLKERNLL